ncbi:unnamed protein product [Cyprideis torosa]|uniref:Uncharacterized protein n=1 Tax=Cyprideis torosa TaxID=163714 RepID=A0A7R8WC95_9CRUS|nr:unnamed protein product [Cyprideis torosa]CAG0890461.1 unnamed protein product [Cyprideis torosa]
MKPDPLHGVMSQIAQITDALFLSAARPVSETNLRARGITCIVNATVELPCLPLNEVEMIKGSGEMIKVRKRSRGVIKERVGSGEMIKVRKRSRGVIKKEWVGEMIKVRKRSRGVIKERVGSGEMIKIPVSDAPSSCLSAYFDVVGDKINDVRRKGGTSLVHCIAGVSRSASLCIAYLMKHEGMSLKNAYYHVKGRRPVIRPNNGFFRQLIEYEKKLYRKTSVAMVPCLAAGGLIPDVYEADYQAMIQVPSALRLTMSASISFNSIWISTGFFIVLLPIRTSNVNPRRRHEISPPPQCGGGCPPVLIPIAPVPHPVLIRFAPVPHPVLIRVAPVPHPVLILIAPVPHPVLILIAPPLLLLSALAQSSFSENQLQREPKPFIPITKSNFNMDLDGSYVFNYEAGDGQRRQEAGRMLPGQSEKDPGSQRVEGSYSYTAPNGKVITVNYYADETGFHPDSDVIPRQVGSQFYNSLDRNPSYNRQEHQPLADAYQSYQQPSRHIIQGRELPPQAPHQAPNAPLRETRDLSPAQPPQEVNVNVRRPLLFRARNQQEQFQGRRNQQQNVPPQGWELPQARDVLPQGLQSRELPSQSREDPGSDSGEIQVYPIRSEQPNEFTVIANPIVIPPSQYLNDLHSEKDALEIPLPYLPESLEQRFNENSLRDTDSISEEDPSAHISIEQQSPQRRGITFGSNNRRPPQFDAPPSESAN